MDYMGKKSIAASSDVVQSFMTKVYGFMTLALVVTGASAYYVAHSPSLLRAIYSSRMSSLIMFIGLLALVWYINKVVVSSAMPVLIGLFIAYSVFLGFFTSYVFILYAQADIYKAFFIAGGTFAFMSIFGMFTKINLTGMGQFMSMGLIGIIIASVANMFLKSPGIDWAVTYIGILVFTGLTAYDTQKLKMLANEVGSNGELATRLSVIGAMNLHLDFINLFLFILRATSRR